MRRLNFVSFTFFFAFGLGTFTGIALALLAVFLARPANETVTQTPQAVINVTATPRPSSPTPSPTVTPTPIPSIRTLSTLQVRIGPHQDYAILGTLASGTEVQIKGKDSAGEWLAIEFPPQSAARGWIPLGEVTGITLPQIESLDIVQASLNIIDRSTPEPEPELEPEATNTPTTLEGNDGVPEEETPTEVVVFPMPTETLIPTEAPTQPIFMTPTPTRVPVNFGPTDLAFTGVSVASDGTLLVRVDNLGPGDVPGVSVVVNAEGFAPELLGASVLRAGEGVTLRTTTIVLAGTTNVSITVDPNGELTDANRANNTRNYTLTP